MGLWVRTKSKAKKKPGLRFVGGYKARSHRKARTFTLSAVAKNGVKMSHVYDSHEDAKRDGWQKVEK